MPSSQINERYEVYTELFKTQGLSIFSAVLHEGQQKKAVTLHVFRHRPLIKYYLSLKDQLISTLPFVEAFILDGALYMSFESLENGISLHHRSLSTAQKKTSFLHLLAHLAIDNEIPNFIKWQLLNSENLKLDRNLMLHEEIQLKLVNPDLFNDFKSIQLKLIELIAEIFEAPAEDPALKLFTEKLADGSYTNYLELFTDCKRIFNMNFERDEPQLYTWLYDRYMGLKKHSGRLVLLFILALGIYQVYQYLGTAKENSVLAYQKTAIGTVTFDDPYSKALESPQVVVVKAPQSQAVVPETPAIVTPPPTTPTQPVAPKPSVSPVKPAANSGKDVIYAVKRNEFLVKISREFYGDGKYAWAIAKYNQLKNPSFLRVNYPLKLPPKDVIETLYQDMRSKK